MQNALRKLLNYLIKNKKFLILYLFVIKNILKYELLNH